MATRRNLGGRYVEVREKSTSKGHKGTIMKNWSSSKPKTKKIKKPILLKIFYVSLFFQIITLILIFTNNYISLTSFYSDIAGVLFIFLLVNSPILFAFSIYNLIKKEYFLGVIGTILSLFGIILVIGIFYALTKFT